MLRKSRTIGGAVGAGVIGVMAWVSVAYGCTVSPQVSYSLLPESATPGQTVTVHGQAVDSRSPVDIRWNGVKGPLLATATPTNNAFSVPVKIPDVPAGIYSLLLVSAGGVGRTSVEVTGGASAAPEGGNTALWPTVVDVPASGSSGGPSSLGVGLLAVGLVGLSAGSAVAVTRRRRVLAGTPE